MSRHPVGQIARWSAKHRVGVLVSTAVVMLLLGGGILRLEFRDNPLDAMPKGDPHTEASDALLEAHPGVSYASALMVSVAPEKWAAGNARLPNRVPLGDPQANGGQDQLSGLLAQLTDQASQGQGPPSPDPFPGARNITDEVYMRGMEELFQYLRAEIPELHWGITLPSQIKLVNYTNSGVPNPIPGQAALRSPDASAFSMPSTEPEGAMQFSSAWTTYWYASPDSIKTIVSLDWQHTRFGLLYEPGGKSLNEIGQALYDAVDKYRADVKRCDAGGPCSLQWNVFEPEGIIVDPRAPSAASAYLSEVTLEDVVRLGPFVALFIGASLFIAFRRFGILAAMLLPMGLAGIGVLGVFGLLDLPITSVSLLVFPVLMGNGIDFAIHMASAYNRARSDGKDAIEAAYEAGDAAGTPLWIASMTTIAGMLLLVFAPNDLLTQLGLSILLGMVLLLAISLTALPAALTWTRPAPVRHTPIGDALQANARFWHRNKALGVGVIVVLMASSILALGNLQTLIIGTPAAYFPEDDPQREDFDRSNDLYFRGNEDLVTNAIVMRGDLSTPEAMEVMRLLEERIPALDFVRAESAVSVRFALNAWIQVREGTAGAPLVIAQETAQPGSTFPQTQSEIKFLLDEMFATPLATYATFFVSHPEYQIGTMLVEINQPSAFGTLERQWNELQAVIDGVLRDVPGSGLQLHLSGGTAVGYLFAEKELPYVQVASFIGLGMTGLLVLAIRRSPRDALTVALVVGASSITWVGALALLDIPLSIALVVPVVMIAAIGSDYALHLRFGLRHDGSDAWSTVGRAVFYSAVTDIGAFAIFTQMRYGLLADATLATVVALATCLVMTLIIVPVLARPQEITPGADL